MTEVPTSSQPATATTTPLADEKQKAPRVSLAERLGCCWIPNEEEILQKDPERIAKAKTRRMKRCMIWVVVFDCFTLLTAVV